MRILTLPHLMYIFKILTSTISDLNPLQNGNNYAVEEYSPLNVSFENGSFSMHRFNLTSIIVYETVIERTASPIDVYFTPCLVVFGISGNMMSVYVFFSSKLRYQSTSQYLSALAISDSIFLGDLVPPWLSTMEISGIYHRHAYCKGFVYVSYVTCCLSSWLVIAFTIERFVAVQNPLKCSQVCNVKRARYIILALTVGALLLNLPVIHLADSENQMCHINRDKLVQAAKFNWVDTTATFTIPLIMIIFFNTWIAAIVYKLERDRIKLTQEEMLSASIGQVKLHDADFIYPRTQRRITNMLLIVSTIFVLFNCPAYTMRVCGYVLDLDSRELDDKWLTAQNVATMLFNANFSINFFLYCLTGQNFRRALTQTVPCCGWLGRKTNAVINRSTGNYGRACALSASAASTGTDATCMEMSPARIKTWQRRRRSSNYILRCTFDNSRQRQAAALSVASDSICMHEIASRPGSSGTFFDNSLHSGTSQALSSERSRAIIQSRRSVIQTRRTIIESKSIANQPKFSGVGSRRCTIGLKHSAKEPRRVGPSHVVAVEKRKVSRI